MKNFRFLKNAATLTLTGILLRGLGMLLRVYISSKIGEEGMGLYQLVSSVYFLFITIAQSGIAVIITKLCSEKLALSDKSGAYGVLKSGVAVALVTGITACTMLVLLGRPLCRFWIADVRAASSLYVLAFSLPFIAVCNVLSAYFMAMRNVGAGCSAQILEQITRMGIIVCASYRFSYYGIDKTLVFLFAANTVSEAISCLYLGIRVLLSKRPVGKSVGCKRRIVREAAPVAASRYLSSALRTVENMLVPSAAAVYFGTRSEALSAFGALKGMALPLLFFPYSFLSALSSLLIPEITGAVARNDRRMLTRTVNRTCSFTLAMSVMIGGAFFLFSDSLGMLIYNSKQVSKMLFCLAPIVPFMYLDSVCDGMLKALGKQQRVFIHGCVDSGLRIILTALLVTRFGINGFLGVMVFSNILISVLNFSLLLKTAKVKFDFLGWIITPLSALSVSAIITKISVPNGATYTKIALGCVLFCSVFLISVLILRSVQKVYKNN